MTEGALVHRWNGYKIAHLTSVHYPFDVRIFHKECKTLIAAGYKVTLIAAHEKAELVDGVYIEPVCKQERRSKRMTATVWELCKKALACKADIYHFHDPELLPVGLLLKICGKRVIYDVHEHLAKDILSKQWIDNPYIRKIASAAAGAFENISAFMWDAVVSATPAIATGFPKDKTVLVQNYPSLGVLESKATSPYSKRQSVAVYVGSVTDIRGIREMMNAIQQIPKRLNARLSLVGNIYPEKLALELRGSDGWLNVDYFGFKDRAALSEIVGRARVGLVLFHPVPNHLEAQPNKLYEYMIAGLPVVASDFPLWKDLIEGIGCGITVNPLNVNAVAEAITWMFDHPAEAEAMGERGRRAVHEKYNWNVEAKQLLALYQRLLSA